MRTLVPGIARWLAAALVGAAVLAPLGEMLYASLRVHEVVLPSGRALRAAGHVVRNEDGVRFQVPSEDDPDGELTPVVLPAGSVAAERDRWSLAHYADVWRSRRTVGLLWHSLVVAGGSALLALLLGSPVGWFLARTTLPGRRALLPLLAAPLLLPPFFAAMGVAGTVGAVLGRLGLSGGALQMANAVVCFAGLLFPVPALLVGRALATVPAGLVEAARLLGGPRAALARVTLPSVRPAALAAFTLVFVVALCDFAVPDLLGTFLPTGASPVHVFATEIFLQWSKYDNVGRAVATGAPFVAAVLALLALCAALLRRCPAGFLGTAARTRPLVRLSAAGVALGWTAFLVPLSLGLVLPVTSVASWGFSPTRVPATFRETVGLWDDTIRWLRLGLLSALLATLAAVVLARGALRGGRASKALAAGAAALPLSVPGMVLGVGTLMLWVGIPAAPGTLWKGVLALTGRFLPYALFACWLAMREVDPRLEEAGRLLGATPATLATRVWGPLSRRGIVSAFLLALVFALRELDAAVLIEPGIFPVRIYDKVHFGRTGQVADLSMAYLVALLLPAGAALWLWGRRRPGGPQEEPPVEA